MSSGIGFITEAQIEEKKKVRQEEWERVRKPEEPTDAPEEERHDGRSLFDRLQEQKNLKQEEFDESRRLKNLVKVLDDDECEFLDYVDQAKIDEDKRKRIEEARELMEFRKAVSSLREKHLESAITKELEGPSLLTKKPSISKSDNPPSIGVKRTSQSQLLAGLVKRKHLSSSGDDSSTTTGTFNISKKSDEIKSESEAQKNNASNSSQNNQNATLKQLSGILPGLASYGTSSSDENSE